MEAQGCIIRDEEIISQMRSEHEGESGRNSHADAVKEKEEETQRSKKAKVEEMVSQ